MALSVALLGLLCTCFAQVPSALDDNFNIADPSAHEINDSNFLESERFWPFHIQFTGDQTDGGSQKMPPVGAMGVLLFFGEDGHSLTADFGRDGIFKLPVGATDLIEGANHNRLVPHAKKAPNLVLRYGNKLVDAQSPTLIPFRYPVGKRFDAWIIFIADPLSLEFAQMAEAFKHVSPNQGAIMPIFVPIGSMEDKQVLELLQTLEWSGPFVYKYLASAYLPGLSLSGITPPAVIVSSPEGRLIYAGNWSPETVPAIEEKLQAFRESSQLSDTRPVTRK